MLCLFSTVTDENRRSRRTNRLVFPEPVLFEGLATMGCVFFSSGLREHSRKCAIVSRRPLFRQHILAMLLIARGAGGALAGRSALTRLLLALSTLSSGRGPRPSHQCRSIG